MVTAAKPKIDLAIEQKRIRRQAVFGLLFCLSIAAPTVLILPRIYDFPSAMAERLALVLRADLLVVLWVVYAIRVVAGVRYRSKADNAGSAYSEPSAELALPAAFLQNTLEQAFIAVMAHLALATVAGEAAMAYIVACVVLFALGRITFRKGYPKGAGGRAFGVVVTVLPTVGATVWTVVDVLRTLIRL